MEIFFSIEETIKIESLFREFKHFFFEEEEKREKK